MSRFTGEAGKKLPTNLTFQRGTLAIQIRTWVRALRFLIQECRRLYVFAAVGGYECIENRLGNC